MHECVMKISFFLSLVSKENFVVEITNFFHLLNKFCADELAINKVKCHSSLQCV